MYMLTSPTNRRKRRDQISSQSPLLCSAQVAGDGPPLRTTVLLHFLLSVAASHAQAPEDGIRVLSAEKRIDPIVKVFLTLKVACLLATTLITSRCHHQGPERGHRSHVLIAFTPTEAEHLAIIKATRAEGKRKKKTYVPLPVSPATAAPNGARLYSISLPSPLKTAESTTVEVFYVLTHSLEPFPAEITQSESQLVYYRDSAIVLSPYHVQEQVTYVKTPSSRVESFTRVDPTSRCEIWRV